MMNARHKFCAQRCGAGYRNIEWDLSFSEWWKVWQDSGHWENRGKRRGQYVMARFGDKGPYSVGNVHIITTEENLREFSHPKMSLNVRNGLKQANIGNTYFKGKKHSDESRAKISKKLKGRVFTPEWRAKLVLARARREENRHD